MVNRKELHLKIRFKYVTLFQPSPLPRRSVDSGLWSVAPTGAASSLQLLSPLVRKHALMLRVHRQAASLQALLPTENTARLEHAAVLHLTFVFPQFRSNNVPDCPNEMGTVPWGRLTIEAKPEPVNDWNG